MQRLRESFGDLLSSGVVNPDLVLLPQFDIRSYLRLFNGRMTISGYDRIRLRAYVELRL